MALRENRLDNPGLDSMDLENFLGGKPPDPIFLMLWTAVPTDLSCLVKYEGLHAMYCLGLQAKSSKHLNGARALWHQSTENCHNLRR